MKNKFTLFLSFSLVVAMLTSCGSTSSSNSEQSGKNDSSIETSNDSPEASESDSSSKEDESEDNYDDYYSDEIEVGIPRSFTVDNKSIAITLNSEKKQTRTFYTLSIDDKKYDIISDANISKYQHAQCFFVHKNKHDYIIASLEGKDEKRTTKVFQFTGASLKKVFEAKGYKYFDICSEYLLVSHKVNCLGTWEVSEEFEFRGKDDDSFDRRAGMNKIHTICNPKPLTLKKDVIFGYDDSGEGPKPLKAGDKIYPDFYDDHGYTIGFCDKDGVNYGEMGCHQEEENGKDVFYGVFFYDEEKNLYIDRYLASSDEEPEYVLIKESDLFEENYYEN